MYRDPGIRGDLFTIKQAAKATGISRTMIIRLEKEGFLIPHTVSQHTGYRYYDTFNIHKLLEYRRLRLVGLSQTEIIHYCSAMEEQKLRDSLASMRNRRKMLDHDIELLSLRLEKEHHQSFSFHDYEPMLCLVKEGDFSRPDDILTFAYNGSVEIIARGLTPSVTQNIFTIRYDTRTRTSGDPANPYHVKLCLPIEADQKNKQMASGMNDIEMIPGCHAFSMLRYGSFEGKNEMDAERELLWKKITELNLRPVSDELRCEAVIAPYVNMGISPEDYVMRFAIPVHSINTASG